MKGLDEVMRLKRVHSRWVLWQSLMGIFPVFALINKFRPVLSDGYGGDLIPTLLPDPLAAHYNLLLVAAVLPLLASEWMRRRFHKRHQDDLNL